MRFIDLFAGLGGFHLALKRLGHDCVFACEIEKDLRETYEKNFGIRIDGDIRQVNIEKIPSHEILCAGFPCQPFSKAGDQNGLKCPKWGDLFDFVIKILRYHLPRYLILENVPNLARHNNGETWNKMKGSLEKLGYQIEEAKLSPHQFDIPQIRERIYIVGRLSSLKGFSWPKTNGKAHTSILSALQDNPIDAKPISEKIKKCLDAWQNFLSFYPENIELPSFPIWSMEFGATYPYQETTPNALGARKLSKYKGSHGIPLKEFTAQNRLLGLPSYARTKDNVFPEWKIQFIRQNRELYEKNKKWIKKWLPLILDFPSSFQKLEWNCKGEERDIWKFVIQLRASGVRVKRPRTAPSLVAMTATQVPIIAWQKRYMTPYECANLQSLSGLDFLPSTPTRAYKALGNAVNADVVNHIANSLLPKNSGSKNRKNKKQA